MSSSKKAKTDASELEGFHRAMKSKLGLDLPQGHIHRTTAPLNVPERKLVREIDVKGGPLDRALPGIIGVIGASQSGKTTLAINMVKRKDMLGGLFPNGLHVISPTIKHDPSYQYVVDMEEAKPALQYTHDVQQDIINVETEANQMGSQAHQGVFLDDALFGSSSKKNNPIQNFASVARHYLDAVIVLSQGLKSTFSPALRDQVRIWILMANTPKQSRMGLFEEIGEPFGGADALEALFQEMTHTKEHYNFMLINIPNKTVWNGWNEKMFDAKHSAAI